MSSRLNNAVCNLMASGEVCNLLAVGIQMSFTCAYSFSLTLSIHGQCQLPAHPSEKCMAFHLFPKKGTRAFPKTMPFINSARGSRWRPPLIMLSFAPEAL